LGEPDQKTLLSMVGLKYFHLPIFRQINVKQIAPLYRETLLLHFQQSRSH